MEARSGYPAPETSEEGERPWNRSFHTHSAPYRCVTVSRTELKLEPRLRVNCSFESAPQASSRRRSAQALYWNKKRISSGVTIEYPPQRILIHDLGMRVYLRCAKSAPACSTRAWYDSSSEGKDPRRTSRQYSAAAREMISPTSAKRRANFGLWPKLIPTRSWITRTWPSQSGPAPIPIVGMRSS